MIDFSFVNLARSLAFPQAFVKLEKFSSTIHLLSVAGSVGWFIQIIWTNNLGQVKYYYDSTQMIYPMEW